MIKGLQLLDRVRHCALLVFLGCVLTGCVENASKGYPVTWYPGFQFGSYLANPQKLASQQAIKSALLQPWYYQGGVLVYGEEAALPKLEHVNSCANYLTLGQKRLDPKQPYDVSAFEALGVACHAAAIVATATPSRVSYLVKLQFNAVLPLVLPASFMTPISRYQQKQLQQMPTATNWQKAVRITAYQPCQKKEPATCGVYIDGSGGRHKLELIARGDFNADGLQDVLIKTVTTVKGGSYVSVTLSRLTRYATDTPLVVLPEQ